MTEDKKICLWATYPSEIRDIADRLGGIELTDEQVGDVINLYKKGIEWNLCDYWVEMIEDAIMQVLPPDEDEDEE